MTEELITGLREHLGTIANSYRSIDSLMGELPHPRGAAYLNLSSPESGEDIVHRQNGFVAFYEDDKGQLYEIQVFKREGDKAVKGE